MGVRYGFDPPVSPRPRSRRRSKHPVGSQATGLLLHNPNRDIVLVKKLKQKNPLKRKNPLWGILAGHYHPSTETSRDGAAREAFEESDVLVDPKTLIFLCQMRRRNKGGEYLYDLYKAEVPEFIGLRPDTQTNETDEIAGAFPLSTVWGDWKHQLIVPWHRELILMYLDPVNFERRFN
jgi:ADP-ribose pyrophosphatase YjhB (NUDIX family)